MFCPYCGVDVQHNRVTCPNCGATIAKEYGMYSSTHPKPPQPSNSAQQDTQRAEQPPATSAPKRTASRASTNTGSTKSSKAKSGAIGTVILIILVRVLVRGCTRAAIDSYSSSSHNSNSTSIVATQPVSLTHKIQEGRVTLYLPSNWSEVIGGSDSSAESSVRYRSSDDSQQVEIEELGSVDLAGKSLCEFIAHAYDEAAVETDDSDTYRILEPATDVPIKGVDGCQAVRISYSQSTGGRTQYCIDEWIESDGRITLVLCAYTADSRAKALPLINRILETVEVGAS